MHTFSPLRSKSVSRIRLWAERKSGFRLPEKMLHSSTTWKTLLLGEAKGKKSRSGANIRRLIMPRVFSFFAPSELE